MGQNDTRAKRKIIFQARIKKHKKVNHQPAERGALKTKG